jgi:hypothetical protein
MSVDLHSIMATLEAKNRTLARVNAINKRTILRALKAHSITEVTADFDGMGDSGQIQNITPALPGTPVTFTEVDIEWRDNTHTTRKTTVPLNDAVEHLMYAYLEAEHAGWEINEGSYGTFTFNVASKTVALAFNERSETYSEEEY